MSTDVACSIYATMPLCTSSLFQRWRMSLHSPSTGPWGNQHVEWWFKNILISFDNIHTLTQFQRKLRLRHVEHCYLSAITLHKNNKAHIDFFMLWSQIKLTSYDFSDLHITGEFDNRRAPDDFSEIYIEWSHIVRAPAGVFICKHRPMPGRAPYDIVRCPAGVVRDQPDTVRCPADFIRIFTCNDEYIYIKIRHHSSNETGC